MSDVMLLGVLRMPMPDNPADMGGLEWAQVKDRMRQAADEIEKERAAVDGHIRLIEVLEDEVARLRAELAAADHYTDRIAQLTEEMKERHDEFAAYRIDVNDRITKLREALVRTKEVLRRAGNYDCEYQEDIDVIDAVLKETE